MVTIKDDLFDNVIVFEVNLKWMLKETSLGCEKLFLKISKGYFTFYDKLHNKLAQAANIQQKFIYSKTNFSVCPLISTPTMTPHE